MDEKEQDDYKSKLQEIVPSTRFGQALASLFYLKRHKKRDNYGRAPVVSRLRAPSTSPYSHIKPFEILTATPPPIRIDSLK